MILSPYSLETLFNRRRRKVDVAPEEIFKDDETIHPLSRHVSLELGDTTPRCQIRLGIQRNLFFRPGDTTSSVLFARSGKAFPDLQVTSELNGIVVLKDCISEKAVAVVVPSSIYNFAIYAPRPSFAGQESVHLFSHQELYEYATVRRVVDKVLGVHTVTSNKNNTTTNHITNTPTWTIHSFQNVAHCPYDCIQHVIKNQEETPVAFTRYRMPTSSHLPNSFMLATRNGSADPILMILLAAIADQVDMTMASMITKLETHH